MESESNLKTGLSTGSFDLEQIDYQIMIYQWPQLRHFIFQCWKNRDDEKLLDFLFAIETEDQHLHGGH